MPQSPSYKRAASLASEWPHPPVGRKKYRENCVGRAIYGRPFEFDAPAASDLPMRKRGGGDLRSAHRLPSLLAAVPRHFDLRGMDAAWPTRPAGSGDQ